MNASTIILGAWIALFAFAGIAQSPGEQTPAPASQTAPSQKEKKGIPKPAASAPAPSPKAADATPSDSPLVRAAKKNKNYKIAAGTVITNANVGKASGSGGRVFQEQGMAGPAPEDTTAGNVVDNAGRDKAYWQSAMQEARQAVTTAQERVNTLQTDINRLQNDFYSRDDPAYRDGVIKPALDQALADIEKAKRDVETAKKRLTDLSEEARKSGALPGWLR